MFSAWKNYRRPIGWLQVSFLRRHFPTASSVYAGEIEAVMKEIERIAAGKGDLVAEVEIADDFSGLGM